MFATATKNFVEEIDHDGYLIPVTCLNDSNSLAPLSLVVKRKRFWFWQKPKYLPTDFTLNDVLTGDTPINPVVVETDFLKYNGTFGNNIEGNVDTNLVKVDLNMEGKDTSKLQSSFGTLKKEELDVQKLLRDSKDKVLDMSHSLIQQTQEKSREVFGVVKETIVTTQPCSVVEEVQQSVQLGGLLSSCGPKSIKVSVKQNSSIHKDSNVSIEIPARTVIAYGLIELEVNLNGHYDLCLMSDTLGGFEVDGPAKKDLVGVSGACGVSGASKNSYLQGELDSLSGHFQLLLSLPASTRSSLLQLLMTTMEDRQTVTVLENVLNQICGGEKPDLADVKEESVKQTVQATLDLLHQSGGRDQTQTHKSPSLLTGTLLIISAMDELEDEGLSVLASCCSPPVLQALQLLVQSVTGSGESSLKDAGLAPLAEEKMYERVERLFACSDVTLKRQKDILQTEISKTSGNLPLAMCITVKGLASLGHTV